MKKEAGWMFGCVAITLLIVELTIGLEDSSVKDIRLHDTYIVIDPINVLLPIFVSVTALSYVVRCILSGFTQVVPNLVLIGSAIAICIIGVNVIVAINQSAQGGWVVYPPLKATPQETGQRYEWLSVFLQGSKDLLIFMVATWGIIALTTTVKTVHLFKEKPGSV